jgi:outer membrane protein OmpA-like peptidoglycan-associated protein
MKKLLIPVLLSSLLLADCTPEQEKRANSLWRESIHKNTHEKLKLLNRAEKICPLELIRIDKKIIDATNAPTLSKLKHLKNANNLLNVNAEYITHKYNNGKKITQFFLQYLIKEQKNNKNKKGIFDSTRDNFLTKQINYLREKPLENTLKAIGELGGTYKADLLFNKSQYAIKDKILSQQIINVIHEEVKRDSNALFGLEGGASSEGLSSFNKKLSKKRGEALEKEILKAYPQYQNNIRVFAMGESELVCEGKLLPEENSKGEYECLSQENREKSRRVSIRRIR